MGHYDDVMEKAGKLCRRKNLDYGPGNISQAGLLGIVVRMGDKYQRLLNLTSKSRLTLTDSPAEANGKMYDIAANESVEDSLLDLMNYCAIALLWLQGHWGKGHFELFSEDH